MRERNYMCDGNGCEHGRWFRHPVFTGEPIVEMPNPQDEYLRRPDGSIYGMRKPAAAVKETYRDIAANLGRLPYPDFDGNCRIIDLGTTYALIDWDGEYRVGLYYDLDGDQDDGGICATFERFEDCEAFCERLAAIYKEVPR